MHSHSLQFFAPTDERKQLNSAAFIQGYLGVNVGLNSVRGHMVHCYNDIHENHSAKKPFCQKIAQGQDTTFSTKINYYKYDSINCLNII